MDGVIDASTEVRAALEHIRDRLVNDAAAVVGDRRSENDPEYIVRSSLTVDMNAGPGVEQGVLVELVVRLGPVQAATDTVLVPLSWRAVGWPRLFPSFTGIFAAHAGDAGSTVHLRGGYTVATGPLGRFGDGVAGRRLARQAGSAFLEQAARRIDGEEPRRADLVVWRPAPYPVAVQELVGSDDTWDYGQRSVRRRL